MKFPDAPLKDIDHEAMLAKVNGISANTLAPMVERVDREGCYPRDVMHALGAAGAYSAHLRAQPDFGAAIRAMAAVSRVCGATGFMVWCQDVCGLYIEQSGNSTMIERRLDAHASGKTLGGTGMSNPMKTFAGIETLLLRGKKVLGGYQVSGALPWVSNIGPDHYFGGVFAVDDQAMHEVMFMLDCNAPGVTLKRCPEFSAMEGTNTFSVRLSDVFIGEENIISDPVRPYLARIRGAFVLMQTGMGLGVTQGAIDSMRDVEDQLGHVNCHLDERPADLQGELDALATRVMHLAEAPYNATKDHVIEILDARAHCSELSLRATQSALLHQGARGYLMSAAPQRRIREAHFVAIVTPALKHLRKEIARLSKAELPA